MFKIIALDSLLMGQAFTRWLKLGHYMKIPPRANFHGEFWQGLFKYCFEC